MDGGADGGGHLASLTRLSAGSFFGAVIPPGCVLDVEVPPGLSLRLTNVAVASSSGRSTLLVSQGADGPLASVATVQDGQVALGIALAPGCCRLAADGDALTVSGRVRQLLGNEAAARALDADLAGWTALFNTPREGVARISACAKADDVRSFHPGQAGRRCARSGESSPPPWRRAAYRGRSRLCRRACRWMRRRSGCTSGVRG